MKILKLVKKFCRLFRASPDANTYKPRSRAIIHERSIAAQHAPRIHHGAPLALVHHAIQPMPPEHRDHHYVRGRDVDFRSQTRKNCSTAPPHAAPHTTPQTLLPSILTDNHP